RPAGAPAAGSPRRRGRAPPRSPRACNARGASGTPAASDRPAASARSGSSPRPRGAGPRGTGSPRGVQRVLHVLVGVRDGDEPGLVLARRDEHAVLPQATVEAREGGLVGPEARE